MGYADIVVDLVDHWPKTGRDADDGDRDIAKAAWASTYDRTRAEERDIKDVLRVVGQVVDHKHDTPKESVWLKYFITFPIFVERQYDKYRMTVQEQDYRIEWYEAPFGRWGVTQNELSGRYRTIPDRFYGLPVDVKEVLGGLEDGLATVEGYDHVLQFQYSMYKQWLDRFPVEWKKPSHPRNKDYKRCREVLRGVLGTSFLTDMRIVMNLNAFEHMVNQRLEPGSQLEARITAYQMVVQAIEAKVAPCAIEKMVEANEWRPWLDEIEALVKR